MITCPKRQTTFSQGMDAPCSRSPSASCTWKGPRVDAYGRAEDTNQMQAFVADVVAAYPRRDDLYGSCSRASWFKLINGPNLLVCVCAVDSHLSCSFWSARLWQLWSSSTTAKLQVPLFMTTCPARAITTKTRQLWRLRAVEPVRYLTIFLMGQCHCQCKYDTDNWYCLFRNTENWSWNIWNIWQSC